MANPGFGKRIRERKRDEKQKQKAAKREKRKDEKKNRPDDYDPFQIVEQEKPPLE
jgi:hypothetical protein